MREPERGLDLVLEESHQGRTLGKSADVVVALSGGPVSAKEEGAIPSLPECCPCARGCGW